MGARASIESLERMLNPRSQVPIRQHAASVWSLCSHPEELAEWVLVRLEQGLWEDSTEERYLKQVLGCCQQLMLDEVKPVLEKFRLKEAVLRARQLKAEKERVEEWNARKAAIIKRDEERRRGPAVVRLEKALKQSPAPEPEFKPRRLTAAERMDRAWRRRRYLTVAS